MTPMCLMAKNGIRYIPIPKCASTSITAALFGLQGSVEEIHTLKPRLEPLVNGGHTFAVIRNPADRLISTWANKVWRPHRPDTQLIRRYGVKEGMQLGDFVSLVEERGVDAMDVHIRPQISFLPDSVDGVVLMRMERLLVDWRDKGYERLFGPLGHLNESCPPTFPNGYTGELWSRICRLYIRDAIMWDSLR